MKPEADAIVYCQGAFNTANGKTAHGLVRFTRRYRIRAVVDRRFTGRDAGEVLDGIRSGIPIHGSIQESLRHLGKPKPSHLVVGLAPDGGRLRPEEREEIAAALDMGLHIDSGLHDFLSEDPALAGKARERGLRLRDIRKPPPRDQLHFFSGKINQVTSVKLALLGTDSAVGKRTTAWLLVDALNRGGRSTEMVGTGQTAWMQGARFGIILDSLVNDFVSGEIEHAVWSAWREAKPSVIVIEGQGSLLNPAYPGGFEILAAGRPDMIVLQHAPARHDYDGFPGYPIHPLDRQIAALAAITDSPVAAVTLNHEGIPAADIPAACDAVRRATGLPAFDVLSGGAEGLAQALLPRIDTLLEERNHGVSG